jgi:2-oxoglutarate ferredoxin oxidoreductase subunit gamma
MEDLQVSWLPSYGPEMRGGTANCNVIISENPVGSPIVTNADVLIAMNLPSLLKYVDSVVPGGQIYVDSTLIDAKIKRTDVDVYYIPATQIGKDNGIGTLANMVMVGDMLEHNPELSFDGYLCALASIRAYEVSQYWSHNRLDGSSWNTILTNYGYGYNTAAENLAQGSGNMGGYTVVSLWANSEGHMANMINPDFTHTGVGVCHYNGMTYVACLYTG